jgi:SAM-dependent methyltransferase
MNTEISPHDGMWEGDRDEYFQLAATGLGCVQRSLAAAGRESAERILDFGCGHGRVMRALRDAYPAADLTACDLDADGVQFCVDRFGARAANSTADITQISLPGDYDLIWCGSVFTHLDAPGWRQLVQRFGEWLAPGGVVVFTTHGQFVAKNLRAGGWDYGLAAAQIDALLASYAAGDGFGYVPYPRRTDYGMSISDASWVRRFLAVDDSLDEVAHEEGGWNGWQDSFAYGRAA